jgi:hypothetical protein
MADAPNSMSHKRGYKNCVDTVESKVDGLRVERKYFTNTHAGSREFYMNARGMIDGSWGPVKIACETSRSGHRVLTVSHKSGTYVGRTSPSIAQN